MILNEAEFEKATGRTLINCKCDYCGEEFDRPKRSIIRGRNIIKKDSCGKSQCIVAKRSESSTKKYGTSCCLSLDTIKQQIEKTNIEKYGFKSAMQNKDVKSKQENTLLKKYGENNPSKIKKFQEKKIETSIKKYGKSHYSQTEEFNKRIEKTSMEKYGKSHYTKTEEFNLRVKQTNFDKRGFYYPSQDPSILQKIKANPQKSSYGKKESEVKTFLNSIGINANRNITILNGKEIDLLFDNIGIEFCGLYWHNEKSPEPRDKNYHHNKYVKCKNKNIFLITIFEDEWNNRRKQCENRLKSIFGIHNKTIYGRNCELKVIDKNTSSDFIDTYHIQGSNKLSIINFGLFYNKELVQVLSLGRHPRKHKELTLDRMCFKDNIKILGGSQKLFKAAKNWAIENNNTSIISWSDNRWSQGKVYEHLGFKLDKELGADYSYVDLKNPKIRLSKQSQKKKENQLQTESQMAHEKGLAKIWDCGKKRWIYYL